MFRKFMASYCGKPDILNVKTCDEHLEISFWLKNLMNQTNP